MVLDDGSTRVIGKNLLEEPSSNRRRTVVENRRNEPS